MKAIKIISILCSVGVVLASCAKDEQDGIDPEFERVPIVFGLSNEGGTKGTALTGTTLPNGTYFDLYAFEIPAIGNAPGNSATTANRYTNDFNFPHTTTYNTSTGVYVGNTKYWPATKNNRLKFMATYPRRSASSYVSIGSTYGTNHYVYMDYMCDDNPANHVDILYANTGDLSRQTVNLKMKHATTRLTFSARVLESPYEVKFTKISYIKFYGISRPNVLQKRSRLWIRGDDAEWDHTVYASHVGTYEFRIGRGLADIELEDVGSDPSSDPLGQEYYRSIMENGESMMIIPQPTDDIIIEVGVLVMNKDGTPRPDEINYFLPLEVAPWEPGNHIHYKLTVARDVVNVGAVVGLWDDATTGEEIVLQ